MIFVVLGTQDKKFERLLKEIEQLIEEGIITEKVIVQAGKTNYKSSSMEIHKMIPMKKFLMYIEQSDYIITHGGVGTILDAMKFDKKIIAVPRLKMYGEHENDHQTQIIEKFANEQYLIGCHGVEDLKKAIQKIRQFKPKKCHLGNEKMLNLITNYIEATDCSKQKNIRLDIFYTICACFLQLLLYLWLRSMMKPLDTIWVSWIIAYIGFIQFRYQKRNHGFEFIFGIFLSVAQWLWFNLCSSQWHFFLIILISYLFTCISHYLFDQRRSQ